MNWFKPQRAQFGRLSHNCWYMYLWPSLPGVHIYRWPFTWMWEAVCTRLLMDGKKNPHNVFSFFPHIILICNSDSWVKIMYLWQKKWSEFDLLCFSTTEGYMHKLPYKTALTQKSSKLKSIPFSPKTGQPLLTLS